MTRPLEWLQQRWQLARADALRLARWFRQSGPFYAGSAAAHILAVIVLLSWTMEDREPLHPVVEEIDTEIKEPEVARFIIGTPPVRPSELTAETLALHVPSEQKARKFDNSPLFEDAGGGTHESGTEPAFGGFGGFIGFGAGPPRHKVSADNGIGIGLGSSFLAGNGGPEEGFNGAGKGERHQLEGPSEQRETERAVAAALNWLARHQHEHGNWSLTGFAHGCQGETCTGACDVQDDVLATALALLPFLASGQAHRNVSPYQRHLERAVDWLLLQQASNGSFNESLSAGEGHAILTYCLCEVYGVSGDQRVGAAAQLAVRHLETDASRTLNGWQWAAITSAQKCGLFVDATSLRNTADWYAARKTPAPAPVSLIRMESAFGADAWNRVQGLSLATEQMQASEAPISSAEVLECLLTIVSAERDEWNRNHDTLRRRLLASQERTGCATGSWSGETAGAEWLPHQGRLPSTCFAAIMLASRYRQLPIMRAQPPALATRPTDMQRE